RQGCLLHCVGTTKSNALLSQVRFSVKKRIRHSSPGAMPSMPCYVFSPARICQDEKQKLPRLQDEGQGAPRRSQGKSVWVGLEWKPPHLSPSSRSFTGQGSQWSSISR